MNQAVISCLHANLPAVEAVLKDIELQGITNITCLGDLVGYGPQPNEVIELIRDKEIPTCQGCWDEDVVDGLDACDCSYPSQLAEKRGHFAHQWTTDKLTTENKDYLANLPYSIRKDKCLFVHGSPNSQHEYLLPDMDAFAALERVENARAEILFCGHTHQPYIRELADGSIAVKIKNAVPKDTQEKEIQLPMRRIVNAGSVGEPRHGGTKATYVVYNDVTNEVKIREVEYDIELTCKAIIDADFCMAFKKWIRICRTS
jgi:diadenosine tetraphosphatase ApaH/serine/threonine PP2A family protein phosphatase